MRMIRLLVNNKSESLKSTIQLTSSLFDEADFPESLEIKPLLANSHESRFEVEAARDWY